MSLREKTEHLKSLFYYDETSYSCLRRKIDWVSGRNGCTVRARVGDVTGSLSGAGYFVVYDGERLWFAHVVAWIVSGREIPNGYCLDHLDGDKQNNKLENLRLATDALNGRNQKKRSTNSSGITGIHLKRELRNGQTRERWIAQWHSLEGKRGSKSFDTAKYGFDRAFELAVAARTKAIEELNSSGAGYTERHGA